MNTVKHISGKLFEINTSHIEEGIIALEETLVIVGDDVSLHISNNRACNVFTIIPFI